MPILEIIGRRGKTQYPRRRITSTGQIVPSSWFFLDQNHITTWSEEKAEASGSKFYFLSDLTNRWGLTPGITHTLIRRVQWNNGEFEVGGWNTYGKGGSRLFVMGDKFLADFARVLAKYPVKPVTRAIVAIDGVARMVQDRAGTGLSVNDFRATATEVIGLAAQFTESARTLAKAVDIQFPAQVAKFEREKVTRKRGRPAQK